MLSDRPYMRDDYPRDRTSAVTWIISATVAAFVLQFVFLRWFGSNALRDGLELSVSAVKNGQVWTLLTYSLLHSTENLLHIVSNLLGLYFLGRVLEPMLGRRRFAWFYAAAIVTGALLWIGTHWDGSGGSVIGASAGVAGLFVVFACFYPNQPITLLLFFILPVTLKPKYVAVALLMVELLGFFFYEIMGAVSPFGSGIAFSAHLGGMLAGWIYYRYLHQATWQLPARRGDIELPKWLKKGPKPAAAAPSQVDVTRREDLRAEVDRILDKINSNGFGSLTAEEKRLLDDARELLSRR